MQKLEFLLISYEHYRAGGLPMVEAFVEAVEDYVLIYGDSEQPLGILDVELKEVRPQNK